MYTEIKTIK